MGIFHHTQHYSNPADAAMPYMQQIPETVTPYYQGAINLGKGAVRTMAPIQQQMATDPGAFYNGMMSGYEPSDQYNFNQQQLMNQQRAAAAAGGFAGTPYDQGRQAELTHGLLSQDEQEYFNNLMGIQNKGMNAGMDYFHQGYDASSNLANLLGQNLAQEAGLAYQGEAFKNQMKAQQASNRFGLLGTAIGAGTGYMGTRNQPSNQYYGYDPNASPAVGGYSPRYT